MRVSSLGREDPLEEEMATHSSILAWKIPWMEESLAGYSPWAHKESDMTEQECNNTEVAEASPQSILEHFIIPEEPSTAPSPLTLGDVLPF